MGYLSFFIVAGLCFADLDDDTPLPAITASPIPTEVPRKASPSPSRRTKQSKKLPIHWRAESFSASRQDGYIELEKDVVVTQDDMQMTADKAKIFMDKTEQVSKVEAYGNVKIVKGGPPKTSAQGQTAIYELKSKEVVLTGKAALWREQGVIRGKKITYNLETGWAKVNQVEGVMKND